MTERAAGTPFDANAVASAIEALPLPAALLDARGVISGVNAAWQDAEARLPGEALGPGDNLIHRCEAAGDRFDGAAGGAGIGVGDVVAGRRAAFALEYWQPGPPAQCYRLSAHALPGHAGALLLHTETTSCESADARTRRLAHALGERVKEQRALFEAVRVLRDDSPAASALAQVVQLLPPAMQYPAVTEARVAIGAIEARTAAFAPTPWMLRRTFTTADGTAASIEIAYLEVPAASADGPFLPEERHLVESLAALLETFADRRASRESLEATAARLRASESRLRDAQRMAQLGHWDLDSGSGALQWSDVVFQILGVAASSFTPSVDGFEALVHEDDRAAVRAAIDGALLGQSAQLEHRVVRPDGVVRRVQQQIAPSPDAPERIIGTIQDITQLKDTERERDESDERFRQLAERIEEVFWLTDVGKQAILYVSPGYEKIWGRSCASLYANPQQWLDSIHPDDRARVAAALPQQPEGHYAEEYRIIRLDGVTRWILDRAFPVRDESGAVYRVAGVALDVTERRENESRMLRAQRLDTIGMLAGGISHDLNNVLAPIMMAIDLLRDDLTSPAQHDLLDTLHASAQRGADLIQQLLTFARGRDERREPVHLARLAAEVGRVVRETFPKDIRLTLDVEPGVPAVLGDATQLSQVLMNLVLNARDAMTTGGDLHIDIRSRAGPISAGGPPRAEVIVRVADTGHGIPSAAQERIFDPFYTTKEIGKGTGLGLATVAAIVRSHGGSIDVDSAPGHGARFTVCLPGAGAQTAPAAPDAPGHRPRGNGARVLVIDDEDGVRLLCTTVLERHGYRVVSAVNGAEGVDRFAEAPDSFALVITDMDMPVMNGPATIVALKEIRPGVRIVASTGHAARHPVTDGVTVLTKPYTAGRLLALVASSIGAS